MDDYIIISTLNDFFFCPYSIYLHNVYMDADEGLYHAAPQTRGKIAHEAVDNKTSSNRKQDLLSLPIYSARYKLMGKVDVFRQKEKLLIERKYQLKHIYQGQIYQLWAQYFCLLEMGYEVERIAFYEISTNKMFPISLPGEKEENQFAAFIERFQQFNPEEAISVNTYKCRHCIYCNLCDKTDEEYRLKIEKNADYTKVFFDALIPYKIEIFKFVRSYYRCFMQNKKITEYPKFEI